MLFFSLPPHFPTHFNQVLSPHHQEAPLIGTISGFKPLGTAGTQRKKTTTLIHTVQKQQQIMGLPQNETCGTTYMVSELLMPPPC